VNWIQIRQSWRVKSSPRSTEPINFELNLSNKSVDKTTKSSFNKTWPLTSTKDLRLMNICKLQLSVQLMSMIANWCSISVEVKSVHLSIWVNSASKWFQIRSMTQLTIDTVIQDACLGTIIMGPLVQEHITHSRSSSSIALCHTRRWIQCLPY